ncbi:MAG: hypothetical protein BRC34_08200 [Cyanobacteria bacterium QH_1_48_107]|nr:MAG: hypothetical protein BRC34_08200 [Cyanobacteria bacterium QH_1_48_107]
MERVRLIRKADGYYCQFRINRDVREDSEPTGKAIGLDVGLECFYTDSDGEKQNNPRFLRTGEEKLQFLQLVSLGNRKAVVTVIKPVSV